MTRRKHLRMNHLIQLKGGKLTKSVTSSNKSSTFTAKRESDNEETPLKQTHQEASTSKQEIL